MVERTRLKPEQLKSAFADLHPPLSTDEAVAEAARCLYCYDAPCTRACPTGIDVPRFIRQILHDNPIGAAETIFEENVFGGSCARACPTEVLCEGACVDRTLLKAPVEIGRLQRFATDAAQAAGSRFFAPGPDTGRQVAVVGAGPAGLSCAHELRRLGHRVTVFESRDVAGGLNTLGIAAYKISTEFALAELEPILEMGMDVRLGHSIDGPALEAVRAEYDAVFLGVGLGPTYELGLPGEDLDGVWEALDFVFQTHTGPLSDCRVGRDVVVVGAGNTAIDVATEAVRLGATRVRIVYRRQSADMSAFAYEYELAKADGVEFVWNTAPVAFEGEDGHVTGMTVQQMKGAEAGGRAGSLEAVPGTRRTLHCDMVIKALGQTPALDLVKGLQGVRVEGGRVLVDPRTGATDAAGLFAGGDCTSKGAEIVDAVQEGKIAARGIHETLSGHGEG